jgi:hypothetical protein
LTTLDRQHISKWQIDRLRKCAGRLRAKSGLLRNAQRLSPIVLAAMMMQACFAEI